MYKFTLNNLILPGADMILGLSVQKKLEWMKKVQWYAADDLALLQKSRLKNLLIHSSINIPYYSEICMKIAFSEHDDPVITLKKFPFLDKNITKANLPNKILDQNRRIYFTDYTSGSSGIQGMFHFDRPAYSMAVAIQMLWWQWAGYGFGDTLFQLGMTTQRGFVKGIKDILLRVKYADAFQVDDKAVCNRLKSLRGRNDFFFMGYASALYEYARIASSRGYDDISFRSVVSWGDKMFPHYRALIEKQFKTRVFDTYASNENTMIAAECEHHNYHIMSPHIYLEILDDNGNEVPPGEMGHVVVTRLDNFLMPLIRYRIGDLAIRSADNKVCPCGRQLPLLEKIVGRDTDIVYTPGGKSLIVHFFTGIFEFFEEIRQFQVEQHTPDDIEIYYIRGEGFSNDILDKIKKIMFEKADEEFNIRFTEVFTINPSPSGKPQIIISRVTRH